MNTSLHSKYTKKTIPTTKHAKFLGVTFDQSLTFLKHINITVAKAQSRVHKLHKIFNQHYGPYPSAMIRLYKIFILPLFEYRHTATISATDNAIGKQPDTIHQKSFKSPQQRKTSGNSATSQPLEPESMT